VELEREIREFLTTRRALLSPQDFGFASSPRRRVTGLRRSEVADLAGVSTEYYSKLERGNLKGVSEGVLQSISKALRLTPAENEHLCNLASAQNSSTINRKNRGKNTDWKVRQEFQWILDGMTHVPAIMGNNRNDFVGANLLGRALYSPVLEFNSDFPNFARFTFLSEKAHDFFLDWDQAANDMVANLRIESSRNPNDKALHELIGELSTLNTEFRNRWANHNVRHISFGTKHFIHPIVGQLDLVYQGFQLNHHEGIGMAIYSAEPGSPTEERLRLLSIWASTKKDLPSFEHSNG
jgi:transcriptional regulator with XRE-family HTH domain